MQGAMHLRPWEIRLLSFDEIALALDEPDGKRRPPTGSKTIDPMAAPAFAEEFRRKSAQQRLDDMRRG